jgi:hypothetical protein
MQNPFSRSKCFRLLDWILHYTLFHGFDTLGSHLREEGSIDYDGGLVRMQVQTNFDMIINRQQSRIAFVGSWVRRAGNGYLFILAANADAWANHYFLSNETCFPKILEPIKQHLKIIKI